MLGFITSIMTISGRDTSIADAIFTQAEAALADLGLVSVREFGLPGRLRADLIALDDKGLIHIVEVKSGRADYESDSKWHGYREWCDHFWFAVNQDFPLELLPDDTGLILADTFGAEAVRPPPLHGLAAARRKKLLIWFARKAAQRLAARENARLMLED